MNSLNRTLKPFLPLIYQTLAKDPLHPLFCRSFFIKRVPKDHVGLTQFRSPGNNIVKLPGLHIGRGKIFCYPLKDEGDIKEIYQTKDKVNLRANVIFKYEIAQPEKLKFSPKELVSSVISNEFAKTCSESVYSELPKHPYCLNPDLLRQSENKLFEHGITLQKASVESLEEG